MHLLFAQQAMADQQMTAAWYTHRHTPDMLGLVYTETSNKHQNIAEIENSISSTITRVLDMQHLLMDISLVTVLYILLSIYYLFLCEQHQIKLLVGFSCKYYQRCISGQERNH